MNSKSNTFWREFVRPLFRRPTRVQVAALCFRDDPEGKSILLITSRDSGRWIIPKGWPINGKNGPESALEEAWEEAGVVNADIDATPIGHYEYLKRLDAGMQTKVRTQVYCAKVKELADDYPEASERDRRWVSPAVAAGMVAEPQLRDILNAF